MLFVHFVDGVVLDGEQHKPLRVLGQDRLFLLDGGKGGTHANSNDYIASLIAVINQIGRQFNFDLEIVLAGIYHNSLAEFSKCLQVSSNRLLGRSIFSKRFKALQIHLFRLQS